MRSKVYIVDFSTTKTSIKQETCREKMYAAKINIHPLDLLNALLRFGIKFKVIKICKSLLYLWSFRSVLPFLFYSTRELKWFKSLANEDTSKDYISRGHCLKTFKVELFSTAGRWLAESTFCLSSISTPWMALESWKTGNIEQRSLFSISSFK